MPNTKNEKWAIFLSLSLIGCLTSYIHIVVFLHICRMFFAGLVKAKKYDWKDSNMSMVGSDTDRSVKSK